jgi:hypothetical protein
MEQQLNIVLEALVKDIPVRYISETTRVGNRTESEIYIEKYKLNTCPEETQILNALEKRIRRSDTLRSQKYTLGICVLLLLSKGYCVTSSTLSNVQDSFIERCWECIQVVSQNIPVVLSEWIQSAMGTRTPSGYSVLFCNSKVLLSSVDLLKDSISGSGKFLNVNAAELGIPSTLWHRRDVVSQTMVLHMRLQDRDLS